MEREAEKQNRLFRGTEKTQLAVCVCMLEEGDKLEIPLKRCKNHCIDWRVETANDGDDHRSMVQFGRPFSELFVAPRQPLGAPGKNYSYSATVEHSYSTSES